MIVNMKIVVIALGLALTAFLISTIVLAVQKADLKTQLHEAWDKLEQMEQGWTTVTTPAPSSTSTSTSISTSTSTPTSGTTESTEAPETTEPPEEKIDYRLPRTLTPVHYDLYLHPNIVTGNFTGQQKITLTVNEATDEIVLHSHDLIIKNIYLLDIGSPTIFVKSFEHDPKRQFLVITLSEVLNAGSTFRLGILYEGTMLNKNIGLYSSSYTKADGSKKKIATSKFEPTYARQAFPCFDEPAYKATYDVVLVHPTGGDYHALSNMDIIEIADQGTHKEIKFTKSVPMSTYLTCFIVSDFASQTDEVETQGLGENFPISVYATPEQIDKVDFALFVGKTVIEYYINYFQIAYPLPKLDMAAIPDFVSGAMETWGLVTYRETALLYDSVTSSIANQERIASVIAHEFAHMWFGNLVTMAWWNDLWLNEGFASYIENKGVNFIFPEFKMLDRFIINTLHGVLALDATLGAHPIIQTVNTPDQITEIFDSITYSKGASIIRMLEDFLGAENFRTAVTNYLNAYKYSNAVTDDFLAEIDKLNLGYNATEVMLTWTVQMGFPVVNVQKLSDTEYKLTQKRFLSNPNDYEEPHDESIFNYRWSIPITYTTNLQATVQRIWFEHDRSEITINLPAAVEWIKFNFDQVGYYRVNYAEEDWKVLAAQLLRDVSVFSDCDRASLLNDAFTLADATQLPYDVALDMTTYLANEDAYVPWQVATSNLQSLRRKLLYTVSYAKYKSYALELIEPVYKKLSWNEETEHLKSHLRIAIFNIACALGLDDCLQQSSDRFNAWLADADTKANADLSSIVYYYGMYYAGNQAKWEQVWERFVAEQDANEKSKLMYTLSAVQEPWLLQQFINLAWNESYVRKQDYFTCLTNIAGNPVGEPLVWDYVRENWENLVERFGLNERYLGRLIPSITGNFQTQTKHEEMQQFFKKYPEAGAGTAARIQALERVKNNIVWLAENLDKVSAWLDNRQGHKVFMRNNKK